MTRFEKWTVWGATIVMALTGFAVAYIEHFVTPVDEWAVVNHPLQPWLLKAHILAGPVLVFGIGLMAARHILPHLRNGVRHARASGSTAAYVIIPMVATGYLLQAITHARTLDILGWVHLAAGAVFTAASVAHALRARRRRAEAARSEGARPTLRNGRPHARVPARRAS